VTAAERPHRVVALPGDGIGPEVMAAARDALAALGDFELEEHLVGGASIDAHGVALTPDVLDACRTADAVLLGCVGGPKWESTDPDAPRPEQGLLALRKGLELFANLRPVRPSSALVGASPLKGERIGGTDLLVVRELTGRIYFGDRGRSPGEGAAFDTCVYSVPEVERIARVAFRFARRKVTSVDKANILETSRLWRETVERVAAEHESGPPLEHMLVDNAAMQLISRPADFDVILTENMFGDILSDEAAMLTGSIGMLASASVGGGGPGLFEPVHGSAPDIAGSGTANPLAMLGSVALMLRYGLELESEARRVESAIDRALEDGLRTPDLGGEHSTEDATKAVLAHVAGGQ
jgi:3-isopropylmalate dehydrogenase